MRQDDGQRLSIAVIIPTYNRAGFVAGAVESALGQTRRPDEVLVVDDGSTDDTLSILERYGPPVRVIRKNKNEGRSAARNTALIASRSDAVMFLDSDDLLLPHCLERMAAMFERCPELGVVWRGLRRAGDVTQKVQHSRSLKVDYFPAHVLRGGCWPSSRGVTFY